MAIDAGGVPVVIEHQAFLLVVLVAPGGKRMASLGKLGVHIGDYGGKVRAAVVTA